MSIAAVEWAYTIARLKGYPMSDVLRWDGETLQQEIILARWETIVSLVNEYTRAAMLQERKRLRAEFKKRGRDGKRALAICNSKPAN